ncbi:hypothetical protein ABRP29_12790 [Pseudomonas sp. WHRI 8822A]|uniref:hypothetical protein n=1 Tax=Pseudomonas sp. WHRI 8822A TaxID=3162568 RepID=UPI0032F07C61
MTTIDQGDRLATQPGSGASFDQVLKHSRLLSSKPADAYRQAKPEQAPPRLEEYERIEAPGQVAADTVRYVTRDGEQVIVYRSSTPALYQRVVEDHHTLAAQADGYTLAVDNNDTLSYYEHITSIDTRNAENGVITYQFGANQWVITQSHTPDTFKRLLHMEKVLAHKNDGYALLGAQQTLPMSSSAYRSIETLADGLTRVETRDGQRYIISAQLNPQAHQQLQYLSEVRGQLEAGGQQGYQVVESLPADYDIDKLKVESIDKQTGLIHFRYDGQGYMLAPGDASEAEMPLPEGLRIGLAGANDRSPSLELRGSRLYDLLAALQQTEGTVAHDALVNAIKNGDILASDANEPVALAEIDNVHAFSEGGVQVITLKDGSKVVAIETMAPNAFKAYAQSAEVFAGIARAEGDGYRLAGADHYLPSTEDIASMGGVGEYGPGLIAFTYRKPGGEEEKLIVSEAINPELFAQVSGHRDEVTLQINDLDALRREHGLPPLEEVSINELPTSETNEDRQTLNVQELALQRMIEAYREGVKDGSIAADDPRARFLRALEAKSMAENGMSIIPEHGRGYKADASDPIDVTSRDVREEIFDVQAIDETLAELTSNETVAADLARFDKEARDKVVGGPEKIAEVEERLKSSANSEAFRTYIKALEAAGKSELAQLEIQQTYLNLAQVDPQAAEQFLGDLSRDTMIMDLDAIMADPSQISEDNSSLAAIDTTNYWLRAARAIPDIPSHLISSWETTIQKFALNKSDAAAFSKIYAELGDTYMRNGVVTDTDIQRAFNAENNAFRSLSSTERDNLTKMFTTMKDTGTLGSVSGIFGLARGIYQLHGNPGNLASTPEGRLAIAADFITFASFSNNFLTLGSKTYDTILNTKVYEHLGLSKSIPEMWGKLPPVAPPGVNVDANLAKHLAGQGFISDTPTVFIPDDRGGSTQVVGGPDYGTDNPNRVPNVANRDHYANFDADAFKRGYLDGAGNTKYRIADAGTGHRIAGSVSRFIGSSADLAGAVTGIVLGAFGIRDGLKNGDSLQTASGFLGVFGGLSGVAAGVASVNGAWGIIGGSAGRIIAAAGPVGFLISASLGFIGAILGTIKSHKLHKVSLEKWEQIKQFESDGLLQEQGASNYVWLQTYLSNYRQRDTPDDRSVFDFRQAEWQGEDETHLDYLGDGANERTGGFSWASGHEYTFVDDEGNEHIYVSGYGSFTPKDESSPDLPKATTTTWETS